jgi:hypothetical protein
MTRAWTTARPTVPGWYWLRQPCEDDEIVEVYEDGDGTLGVERTASREEHGRPSDWFYDSCQWAGPIEAPR